MTTLETQFTNKKQRKIQLASILCWGLLLPGFAGCSFRELKQVTPPTPITKPGAVDFKTVSVAVFQPKCVDCHGIKGGVSLESYAEAFKNLQAVKGVLENREMPPRNPLSAAETELVLQWIADGAPEFVAEVPPPVVQPPAPPAPGPGPQPPQPPQPPQVVLSFESVSKAVFQPSCNSCHGTKGGVNLETYQATIESLQLVKDVVESGDMPPRSRPRLTDSQKALLLDWIAQGAPEFAAPAPGPQPPSPQPPVQLEPTFESLSKLIFKPRCVSCHSQGGRAEWLPLDSWEAIVHGEGDDDLRWNSLLRRGRGGDRNRGRGRGLIDLDRPEDSKIVKMVSKKDVNERMPPLSSGKQQLTSGEIQVLVDWISQGAKNN